MSLKMSKRKSPKAGVPKHGYSVCGSVYKSAEHQEENHITQLDRGQSGHSLNCELENLIEHILNAEDDTEYSFDSTPLQFQCLLNVKEMSVKVLKLACYSIAFKFGFLDMTISSLINLCKNWGEAPLSLSILDPIPPVREMLKSTWVPWSSTCDDPFLPSDRILDSIESIPVEITKTGCCPFICSLHELRNLMIYSPEMHPDEVDTIENSMSGDYLKSLQCLFYRIHLAFEVKSVKKKTFITDAAIVSIRFNESGTKALLTNISVRVCLQGRKIAHMILYVLMDACVRFNIQKFSVHNAYPSSVSILKKLGDFEDDGYYNYTITFEKMAQKTLIACGLNGMLVEHKDYCGYFIINESYFPSSADLNNNEAVDEWFAKRQKSLEGSGAAGV
jgi:hypothetical protein